MIREMLLRVGEDFQKSRDEELTGHPLAHYLRQDAPEILKQAMGKSCEAFMFKGSPGSGVWAAVPWVAVFYPVITETAREGYYVVYLFSADGKTVYLSLNQGATSVKEEFKSRSESVLKERASIVRERLKDFSKEFDAHYISLSVEQNLPKGYEAGHALGKKYQLKSLPPEQELQKDLQGLCKAYVVLAHRGGLDPSPVSSTNGPAVNDGGETLEEIRRYRLHRTIERKSGVSKKVKKYHGDSCQACSVRLSEMYGELGEGYIEAHHIKPLSSLVEGEAVTYNIKSDFAVLCPNCHRMMHRMDDPSDLEGLRGLLRKNTL